MRFPRVSAAQRLQSLLLSTTLAAILLAAFLLSELFSNLKYTVVSDARRTLASALKELQDSRPVVSAQAPAAELDLLLQGVSYDVLRSYPDVEGGYLAAGEVLGHTFPTYTEPGSDLRLPDVERQAMLEAVAESRATGRIADRVFWDGSDLVIVAALASSKGPAAWVQRRYLDFAEARHLNRTLTLVALLLVAMVAVVLALSLSYRMQRGFAAIQAGLSRLQTNPSYRLSEQHHELEPIVQAINEMAESRERLESELRREDRLRVMGRVVAGIAHEIRNPLNSMRLAVQVMARRLKNNPAAEESIPLALAEVDRLDSLLKSLLVFRADDSAALRAQPVRPVLERTIALVRPQLQEHRIDVELAGDSQLQATVDANHLQQAVINLLLNAIDAAGEGGEVRITLERTESGVQIEVADSGPGLSAEQQEHLFEAFYTTKNNGTGLGLAVSRTLLERMGGMLTYVPGSGARFRIVLSSAQPVGRVR
jgi:signal transduction histidine kinase